MSVIQSLAWYAVPRPITDVVVNGVRVYQCFRRDRRQAQNHAEEMFKAALRIAVPIAWISWQLVYSDWSRTKAGGVGSFITYLTFLGAGVIIMYLSSCIAISALTMIKCFRNCAQLYVNPWLRACFFFYCTMAI